MYPKDITRYTFKYRFIDKKNRVIYVFQYKKSKFIQWHFSINSRLDAFLIKKNITKLHGEFSVPALCLSKKNVKFFKKIIKREIGL